jgi:glutathione S-transferase
MLTVFHASKARSVRVLWLLEELGVPHEVRTLTFGPDSLKGAEYLGINPLGRVPAIRDGDVTMVESGAIVEYLLECHGNGRLAPGAGTPERPAYLQWFHFGEATMLPPLSDLVQHSFLRPEAERIAAMVPDAQRRAGEVLGVLERHLAGRAYVAGEFSAADIMVGYACAVAKLIGLLGGGYPAAHAYLDRLEARPAFQKAFAA